MSDERRYERVYILVDCNNFFVSCERIFRPDLRYKPVVVLSNNDGCVIARSNEAKALKIAMGVPVFKVRDIIDRHNVTLFSSNFSLYLDISTRIMTTLESMCEKTYVYSVDECFLILENVTEDEAVSFAFKVKNTIATNIGVPVAAGIACTKTLAKLANHYAKKHVQTTQSIYSILDNGRRERLLIDNPISEIWGIGKALNSALKELNIINAYDLALCKEDYIKKTFNIVLMRTVQELNNIDCIDNSINGDNQHQIMWSRTFKERISEFDDLYTALCNYAAMAAKKLREMNKYATVITVYIRTSYYGKVEKYAADRSVKLTYPSNDPRVMMQACHALLKLIYKQGYLYMKAGVILSGLQDSREHQLSLFDDYSITDDVKRSDRLLNAVDNLNEKYSNVIYLASQGARLSEKKFNLKEHMSKSYTTSFEDLPEVY
ncbi:DNA polymerase V subunit UmuC [Anaerobiospirillum thomasii]|uniref:Y-family DNA polymerase n=1 Tax=Anaerobiospirillum thomasii TaxID=179995 RepID=UPI000D9C97A1|nr:Y-family DNA polymerase [Anaerobiospirillum thomasii]SPT71678.1 DNA polymerase V subunit UmuC [Anaerobiospirillum thomasii]